MVECCLESGQLQVLPQYPNVLIPAPRDVHDHDLRLLHFRSALDDLGDSVRGFERRNNAFGPSQQHGCLKRLGVRGRNILRAPRISEHGMLGADRRVVQTGGDRVRGRDLTRSVLQDVRISSLQNARRTAAETSRVLAQSFAESAGFHSDEFDFFVFEEVVENADGIRSSADAGDDGVGKFAFGFADLDACFASDDAMEVAHHGRIRMRAEHAAEQIVCRAHVGDPVAHGFVDGVFEGARTGIDAANFRAEQAHSEDVELLAAHVLGAHINHALEAEQGADRGGGDAVLTGAGFRDHAVLAHAFDEQALAEAVVDFVRARVEQVFAFEINFRAAKFCGQAAGEEKRRGASSIRLQQLVESCLELAIALGFFVCALQFIERGHQRFRNVPAAVNSEAPGSGGFWRNFSGCLVTDLFDCGRSRHGQPASSMACTAWIKARIFRGSFFPGSRSTPEETSTPQGWRRWIASCTLPGRKPPATISLLMLLIIPAQGCTRSQSNFCPVPPRFSALEESSSTPETTPGRKPWVSRKRSPFLATWILCTRFPLYASSGSTNPAVTGSQPTDRSAGASKIFAGQVRKIVGRQDPLASSWNSARLNSVLSSPCNCTAVSPPSLTASRT